VALVERLKAARPEIAIGADLIAGFPTETEAMFANTLALLDDCDVVHAHIFPYSPRSGTPAARMPHVEVEVVKARAARLREAAVARRAKWLAELVGTEQEVLLERPGDRGHAGNFAELRLSEPLEIGSIVRVKITKVNGPTLSAIPIRHPGLVPGSTARPGAEQEPSAQPPRQGGPRHKAGVTADFEEAA
jgi:threonylcarbamoyladenosine tRNA methylthiotransferase MtaB